MGDVLPKQEEKLRIRKAWETGNRRSKMESRKGKSQNHPPRGAQPAQVWQKDLRGRHAGMSLPHPHCHRPSATLRTGFQVKLNWSWLDLVLKFLLSLPRTTPTPAECILFTQDKSYFDLLLAARGRSQEPSPLIMYLKIPSQMPQLFPRTHSWPCPQLSQRGPWKFSRKPWLKQATETI